MTSGERDGVDYHFLSAAAFRAAIERDEFLEWGSNNGYFYGTKKVLDSSAALSLRLSRRATAPRMQNIVVVDSDADVAPAPLLLEPAFRPSLFQAVHHVTFPAAEAGSTATIDLDDQAKEVHMINLDDSASPRVIKDPIYGTRVHPSDTEAVDGTIVPKDTESTDTLTLGTPAIESLSQMEVLPLPDTAHGDNNALDSQVVPLTVPPMFTLGVRRGSNLGNMLPIVVEAPEPESPITPPSTALASHVSSSLVEDKPAGDVGIGSGVKKQLDMVVEARVQAARHRFLQELYVSLRSRAEDLRQHGNDLLEQEYTTFSLVGAGSSLEVARRNRPLNRYGNVLPFVFRVLVILCELTMCSSSKV